jgi:hypothetical protein
MKRKQTKGTLAATMKNSRDQEQATAAELALKVHALRSDPGLMAEITGGDRMMQKVAETIDLTEAPEDAVCSLVIDLLRYCDREKIDWNEDVMSRARERFQSERTCAVENR